MEEKFNDYRKGSNGGLKFILAIVGTLVLIGITVVVTVIVTRTFFSDQLCYSTYTSQPQTLFKNKETEWDSTERFETPNGKYVIVAAESDKRCYLTPKPTAQEKGKPRMLTLIHQAIGDELLRELAGPEAVDFCQGHDAYLLRELNEEELRERPKRQATEAPSGGGGGGGQNGGERDDGCKPVPGRDCQGLDIPYDQRTPVCMDLVLDCSLDSSIGQVQTCYTWINEILRMNQVCEAPNKFTINLTKPPGRILKIAEKQWVECLKRRLQGLRC